MSDKITIPLDIHFDQIDELVKDDKRNTVIIYKNGDRLTFTGECARKLFRKLARNFEGEHLD